MGEEVFEKFRGVSVPFRGIKNRKAKDLFADQGDPVVFQSPFGELKIGKFVDIFPFIWRQLVSVPFRGIKNRKALIL